MSLPPDFERFFGPRGGARALLTDEATLEVLTLTYLGPCTRGSAFLVETPTLPKPQPKLIPITFLAEQYRAGRLYVFGLSRPWIGA